MPQQKPPGFNTRELLEHYEARRFDHLSKVFLDILGHFARTAYTVINDRNKGYINAFLKNFLYLFTQEDYAPSDRHVERFIDFNPVIANLVAISDFRTTDAFVALLAGRTGAPVKLLTLYNPYNTVRLDRKALFDAGPDLASRWYFSCLENYRAGTVSENSFEHLREHVGYLDDRLSAGSPSLSAGYFGCTYVDPEKDRFLKQRINELVRQDLAGVTVENRPNPRKIGVFTSMWFPTQSVYRSQQPLLKSLADDYELTLIHLGGQRDDLDTELFTEVRHWQKSPTTDLSAISPNEFAMAYFPDVGMNSESILLSNMRIAPIQVSSYGHPVSTFGSQIDYWIGGADIEIQQLADRHYSERLVLIPGAAPLPVYPRFTPENPEPPESPIAINCPWSWQKINYPLLCLLKKVIERSDREVKFQFFPGFNILNSCIPVRRFISPILGPEHFAVYPNFDYATYMSRMEGAHFTIDSYPFGGYNSVIDSIFLRKPVVAQRGRLFYNRASSFLLQQVGLDELITETPEQYTETIVRLVDDDSFRTQATEKLKGVDLDQLVFDLDSSVYFKKAIDFLIENHEKLQAEGSKTPIAIL